MTDTVLPPIKRRKKAGQEIGTYRVKIDGVRVDLGTEDYSEARKRAAEAMTGKRDWGTPTIKVDNPATGNPEDWTADLGDAATTVAGDSPPDAPGENGTYIPPGESVPPTDEGVSTKISPEFFDGILTQAASLLVELQLMGHEFIARRFAKVQLGPVPTEGPGSISRQAGTEVWKAALKEVFPDEVPLPPYLLAPLLVAALAVPVQVAGATAIPDEESPQQ